MAKSSATDKIEQVEKNIYQRGLYSFQVKMMVAGHKISETFDDLVSAREFRDRKRLEATTDPHLKETYQTRISKSVARTYLLADALDKYLAEVTPKKKGASREEDRINKLKRCAIARKGFYRVNAQDIREMFAEVAATGAITGNSQRKYGLILSHLYNVARKEWGFKVDNPIRDVQLPSNGKSRDRRYEPGEERRVLRECRRSRNRWVAKSSELAVASACRQGELFKLEWERVDLDKRVAMLLDTKNGENREIPLSPSAIRIMLDLAVMGAEGMVLDQNQRRSAGLAASLGVTQDELARMEWQHLNLNEFSPAAQDVLYDLAVNAVKGAVFKTTQSAVAQAFKKAVKRARGCYEAACARIRRQPDSKFLIGIRMHDLRHEATSRLFELGIFGDREVMKITGHKTSAMLARYTHLRAENLAEKMAVAEKNQLKKKSKALMR
jgi:integrase